MSITMAKQNKLIHQVQTTEGKRQLSHQLMEVYDTQTSEDSQEALKVMLDRTIKEMMEAEMENHFGYEKSESSDNDDYCKGYKLKRINISYCSIEI